jgi:hypothetical protein
MTHLAAQKMISGFLDDELNTNQLKEFLDHVDACPECKEELTIQFLVVVGMQKLEDGEAFNLNQELAELLRDARKRLNVRESLEKMSIILRILVLIASILTVTLAFILGG